MTLRRALHVAAKERSLNSLALSVHFNHPDLGMKDYEILSRASAFLLSVDAKDKVERMQKESRGPYDHLEVAEERRKLREYKQAYRSEERRVGKECRP